jgi:NADP-reducing hydrogenase subunit HndB
MTKVKSLSDLKAMKENFQSTLDVREKGHNQEEMVQITVAMATCGIASGAKQVMEYMMEKAEAMNISTVFTQTGCMGFCHAEPTVEVKIPGKEPLVFGHVDNKKADEIFEKYILNNEMVDGVLTPNNKVTDK